MSSNVKTALILSLIVVMPALLLARSHKDVWVVDDFESYETSTGVEPMLADVAIQWPPTGGPWWNAYSMQQIFSILLGGGGNPTPPFPTTMSLGEGDPNGFLAFGKDGLEEVPDPNHPKCMIVHYEMNADADVNLLIFAAHTGLPLSGPVGPLNALVADLTKFDKVQYKIKLLDGEPSPLSAVTISFSDENGAVLGYYKAVREDLPLGILGASKDIWQLIEFDLSAQMHGSDYSAKEVCSSVAVIVPGIEDKGAGGTRNVTFAFDDLAFYKESECPQYLTGDVSGDCEVTLADLAMMASQWLQ